MNWISIFMVIFLIAAVLTIVFFYVNRPRNVSIESSLPAGFPESGFSHESFEILLREFVSADGQVDYARWQLSSDARARLDSYLSAVSRFSPTSAPSRFLDTSEELAYWMYAYNGYVIRSVLEHWPVASVTDVKAPLEIVRGLGFFYRQRFSFGGVFLSLFAVENSIIRKQFADPRIHFLLNCASESCPAARPDLPVSDALDSLLDEASKDFINSPDNVYIDHAQRAVYLSAIFKWYKSDFVNAIRLRGGPPGSELLAYLGIYASETLAAELEKTGGYSIRFMDYDWSLNSTS